MSDHAPEGYVRLGVLGKTFGIYGGLRFYASGEAELAAIHDLEELFIAGLGVRALKRIEPQSAGPVLFLFGVRNPEQAKNLVNRPVYAKETTLPEAVLFQDRILDVPVWHEAELLGHVAEVIRAGSRDLIAVETESGERLLLPLQADYVVAGTERIELRNIPEGLLELHRSG